MARLDWDFFWVWIVLEVGAKDRDLLVEGLLEQRPASGEGSNTGGGSTTPKDQVLTVGLGDSWWDWEFGNLVSRSSKILYVSQMPWILLVVSVHTATILNRYEGRIENLC